MFRNKFKFKPIPPMGVSINDSLCKRVLKWLANAVAVAAFTLLLAVLLLEWWVGCGETYVDALGVRHANECLFIR